MAELELNTQVCSDETDYYALQISSLVHKITAESESQGSNLHNFQFAELLDAWTRNYSRNIQRLSPRTGSRRALDRRLAVLWS
jgi:hypothetical protein